MTRKYLFGIADGHVSPLQPGPHQRVIREHARLVTIKSMFEFFCQESFDPRQVTLHPGFVYHIIDMYERQLPCYERE